MLTVKDVNVLLFITCKNCIFIVFVDKNKRKTKNEVYFIILSYKQVPVHLPTIDFCPFQGSIYYIENQIPPLSVLEIIFFPLTYNCKCVKKHIFYHFVQVLNKLCSTVLSPSALSGINVKYRPLVSSEDKRLMKNPDPNSNC